MHHQLGHEDERFCTIANPFRTELETIQAPFTGLLIGVLEDPVVYPGNPLCHVVEIGNGVFMIIEEIEGESN